MASIIRIKRSSTAGNPGTLAAGELAYSALTDNGSNGGDRLYIGIGTETGGNAANHFVIGGKYFTDMLDQTPGTLTASSAIVVDSNSKIDNLKVDNIDLNGNTISTTDSNGNLVLSPNGTGKVSIAGNYTLPRTDGTAGQILVSDGNGSVSFQTPASSAINLAGNSGTDTYNTGETLTISGSGAISTDVGNNSVSILVADATTSVKGVASFSSSDFDVASGAVTIKSGGVDNAQLANSSVTFGNTTVSLGSTSTSIAGVTQLDVDNIRIDGNEISSTNGNGNISLNPNGTGTVDVNSSRITNVTDPTDAQDAATKAYVDAVKTGLDFKDSVRATTTANITLSDPQTIDGVSLSVGDRVLVKDQTNGTQNGIYVVANGSWTRAIDFDNTPGNEISGGAFVFVEEGSTYGDSGWVLTNNGAVTLGTTAITWTQFSGAGQITAGSGLSKTGNTLNVNVNDTTGGIEITADALQLQSTVAGNGLTYTNGVIDVVGTADRITVANNSVDIASTYVGQGSITTVGTITSGTWNANTISVSYGGTGASTLTSNGVLYGNGTGAIQSTAAGTNGYFLYSDNGTPAWTNQIDGGSY